MAVFEDCAVVVDLKYAPFKEKRRLVSAILDNGGNISYVVNQKCSFVVASSLEGLSSSRKRSAQKHQIPVVGSQYVWSCLEKGQLLPVNEHALQPWAPDSGPGAVPRPGQKVSAVQPEVSGRMEGSYPGKFRLYNGNEHDIPEFPSNFQVAKYSVFVKVESETWVVVELQSARGHKGQQYRVVSSVMREATVVQDKQMHSCSSEDALEVFVEFSTEVQAQGFTQEDTLPPEAEAVASRGLKQLLLEERLNRTTISREVGVALELIWTEALGTLSSLLSVPVTSVSLNDVSRVEGLLLQMQKCEDEEEVRALREEVNMLLPLTMAEPDSRAKLVSQRMDLCQLIRDILNVSEATLGDASASSLGKYRALRCNIEHVPSESQEFQSVCKLLQDRPAQVQQVFRVNRASEFHMFREELGNITLLLHSSAPRNFVGILSRGLLLPRVGVAQHGLERTDVGNLGSGIYFSDSMNTSVKYSKPSVADGSRLLLVCEVALGRCKDVCKRDTSLSCAPDGHSSVHAVRRTQNTRSEFEDDEYVVYNTNQVKLKYVVQYFLEEDQLKTFEPQIDTSVTCLPSSITSDLLCDDNTEGLEVNNPLQDVTPGLLDRRGSTLPLEAVHVRAQLMDLLCQVVIFQVYTNQSAVPIEATYVFPLEETATVCGFEAFINGKHVIGQVKEKYQARKEYKQAIEKGHGAYLMDQEAPDVFTISVGNLPAGAKVLIKVTYITELVVRAGTLLFSLPTSVAPWQKSAALNQRRQACVEKVDVNELRPEGDFSVHMSIEMPYEITDLKCSHCIKTKRAECKVVVMTLPDQSVGDDGFQLCFSLSQIHVPRMWVEKHPQKDSEACMLVFYPDFQCSGAQRSGVSDVVIMLDTSESMRGEAMLNARRLALRALSALDRSLRVNVVSFGTDYKEAFPAPRVLDEVFEPARKFIMSSAPVGGSTELRRPLRSLSLLPPSRGLRNVLLLSDGHVQHQAETLQLARDTAGHTRLFTCGLSRIANQHMLRVLAQAGGGISEFFDTKRKHTWAEKVDFITRCMAAPGCRSVSVKWQRFNPTAPPPVQAPSQLHTIFSDHHTLVYGFVSHCTQATLLGDLSGQEFQTMVSTTELQKTKGTFLHKLTARAIIRDYEDGILDTGEAEHEGRKAAMKSYIIELSKEFSILSQFTSFVAIEEREQEQPESGFTSIPDLISKEDGNVDILPYLGWAEEDYASSDDVVYMMDYRSVKFCEEDEEYEEYEEDEEEEEEEEEEEMNDDDDSEMKALPSVSFSADQMCYDDVSEVLHRTRQAQESFKLCNIRADVLPRFALCSPQPIYAPLSPQPESAPLSPQPESPPLSASLSAPLSPQPALRTAHISPPHSSSHYKALTPEEQQGTEHLMPRLSRRRERFLCLARSVEAAVAFQEDTPMPPPPAIAPAAFRGSPAIAPAAFRGSAAMSAVVKNMFLPMSPSPPPPPRPPPPIGFAPPPLNAPQSAPLAPPAPESMPYALQGDLPAWLTTTYANGMTDRFLASPSSAPGVMRFGSRATSPPLNAGSVPHAPPPPASQDLLPGAPSLRRRTFLMKTKKKRHSLMVERHGQPDQINWQELFDLQHQDGYWECTGTLSKFLCLDVEFFANVFLKEKGICSLGVKVHRAILRLLATLLVLQLLRVKMMPGVDFLRSLLHLGDTPEPRPECWDAVERAVRWARATDRQIPCVCTRLELGCDWESCTRQLLGLDTPPAHSALIPVLQRSAGLAAM